MVDFYMEKGGLMVTYMDWCQGNSALGPVFLKYTRSAVNKFKIKRLITNTVMYISWKFPYKEVYGDAIDWNPEPMFPQATMSQKDINEYTNYMNRRLCLLGCLLCPLLK